MSRRVFKLDNLDLYQVDPYTGLTNLELIKAGRSPKASDGSTINLHHLIQLEPGTVVELPSSLHQKYFGILHGLVKKGESFRNDSGLNKQFKNFVRQCRD